ncbi:hypothetical protein C3V43_05310 [Bacteroides heparinolyticus]|nr:hypothetical protein C3V43_05310 [Bacteroides heparinolyticus]
MVSNHLESTWSNPVRNNRAQNYFFYLIWANVFVIFFEFQGVRQIVSVSSAAMKLPDFGIGGCFC